MKMLSSLRSHRRSARCRRAMQITPLCLLVPSLVMAADWPTQQIGAGAISLEPVGSQMFNWKVDQRVNRTPPQNPYLTADFSGPIPSNDWATSLIVDQYSKGLYAQPLTFQATALGFEIATPPETLGDFDKMGETSVRRTHKGNADLLVKGSSFSPADARLKKATDWSYEMTMASGNAGMDITIGHGMPYAFFEFTNSNASVSMVRSSTTLEVIAQDGSEVRLRVLDPVDGDYNYYGVYAPANASVQVSGNNISVQFSGADQYLSVAGVPDNSPESWQLLGDHAYNFITDTRVDWVYEENSGQVKTTYSVTTDNKAESRSEGTVFALFPHQWRNSDSASFTGLQYDSVRGTLETVAGLQFETTLNYNGILPTLPALSEPEHVGMLTQHLSDYYGYGYSLEPKFIQPGVDGANTGYDTYWMGKNLNRLSGLVAIADQLNANDPEVGEMYETLFQALKDQLEYWFDGNKPVKDNYFYYEPTWGTLVGYPSSYDTDTDLNDHHFHYGYWINAAAQIALREPEWAADENWGGMVKELIGDIANSDRNSTRYPFLRNFDLYEGHSWASGVVPYKEDGFYPGGNNNEASSEGVNAWAGLIMWGEATGDKATRDLGIYLYTHEVEAANTYWFNLYGDVGHPQYPNVEISRVWGGGYDHTTWWTEDPIQTHAINWLPITGASMYLGKDPEFVRRNYDAIWDEYELWDGDNGLQNKDKVKVRWQDLVAEYVAFDDPDFALSIWKWKNDFDDPVNGVDPALGIEFGESRAHTYQHIVMLKELGQPDFAIRPVGHTLGTAFNKNGVVTYVAYNSSNETQSLGFSDGYGLLDVPARSWAQGIGAPISLDDDQDGVPNSIDQCPDTPLGLTVEANGCGDRDGDGVRFDLDKCKNTPLGAAVNEVGCPDIDGDGVFDDIDICLDTPAGLAVEANGCGDRDGDGVRYDLDRCPNTPLGTPVTANGCPDSDEDGVDDSADQCPNTPIGETVNAVGCPDLDDDGVFDDVDQCPQTPVGNPVNAVGCTDTDQDGVADTDDLCPDTTPNAMVDSDGCEIFDGDGDGVLDQFDLCPNTPIGYPVNSDGCTDFDQDSVADKDDQCLNTPNGAIVNSVGCPDSDGDSVFDNLDLCPGTPANEPVDADGCPLKDWGLQTIDNGSAILYLNSGDWADAHYRINNGAQQNVRMTQTGSRNEWVILGLNAGDKVTVYFTYLADDCHCVKDSVSDTLTFFAGPVGDDDNDGVDNNKDLCANTPAGSVVNSVGCPDSDGDGVYDNTDQCPGTAAGVTVDANGCEVVNPPLDSDGDGVPDSIDQCANTPAGTSVDALGCPIPIGDWDITDLSNGSVTVILNTTDWADLHYSVNNGAQQNVRMTQTGTRNEWLINGLNSGDTLRFWFTYLAPDCACVKDSVQIEVVLGEPVADSDGDGVSDNIDQCPNTPAGDTVDAVGCSIAPPLDSDGDGVTDDKDLCPNTPAGVTVDVNGCEVQTPDEFGATQLSASSVQLYTNTGSWADVHYWVNGGAQQNVRMTLVNGQNQLTLNGLTAGDSISYSFTYWDNSCNCAKDSQTFSITVTP